MAIIPGKTT